jgi:hypothetical protein
MPEILYYILRILFLIALLIAGSIAAHFIREWRKKRK